MRTLSARVAEVYKALAEGYTNAAIAQMMTIEERTVEAHIATLYGALGLVEGQGYHLRVMARNLYDAWAKAR